MMWLIRASSLLKSMVVCFLKGVTSATPVPIKGFFIKLNTSLLSVYLSRWGFSDLDKIIEDVGEVFGEHQRALPTDDEVVSGEDDVLYGLGGVVVDDAQAGGGVQGDKESEDVVGGGGVDKEVVMIAGEELVVDFGNAILVELFFGVAVYLKFTDHGAPIGGHVVRELGQRDLLFVVEVVDDDADAADVVEVHDAFAVRLGGQTLQQRCSMLFSYFLYRVHWTVCA